MLLVEEMFHYYMYERRVSYVFYLVRYIIETRNPFFILILGKTICLSFNIFFSFWSIYIYVFFRHLLFALFVILLFVSVHSSSSSSSYIFFIDFNVSSLLLLLFHFIRFLYYCLYYL